MSIYETTTLGSSGTEYTITLSIEGNNYAMFCTCPAGQMATHCKHRNRILVDDKTDHLINPSSEFIEAAKRMAQSQELKNLRQAVADAEAEQKHIKKQITALKKQIGRALQDGVIA